MAPGTGARVPRWVARVAARPAPFCRSGRRGCLAGRSRWMAAWQPLAGGDRLPNLRQGAPARGCDVRQAAGTSTAISPAVTMCVRKD